ncbi:MAG: putative membrane-bound spermidine synthase [Gammaproteobacteria bacterium]
MVTLFLSSAMRSGAAAVPTQVAGLAPPGRRWWILPLILASGITSFTYEVLWTRLLAHVLDGSIYAFATMLASFLTGITIGSAIASRFAKTHRSATTGFIISQLGTALFSIAVYMNLDRIPELVGDDAISRVKMSMAVLLPPTLFIGATFPFALRIFATDERDAGRASGKVYAWNTVGAILGAVLAGFFLIPGLGFHGAIRFAVGMNLLIGLGAAFLYEDGRRTPRIVLSAIALAVIVGFRAQPPEQLLRSSPMFGMESKGTTVFQAVGRSATVLMLEHEGAYQLRTNGLPEADILPKGAVSLSRNNQVLLTVLPCFARPQAKSLLSIGFGGGVLLERVPPNIESIDAVELEPEVILANKFVSAERDVDPFADPRLTVIENDARSALALTDKRYDVIVSQPSHPWTAGASHLYTQEFIGQAKQHLTEDGIFLQWMSASFVTEELFKILGSTLLASFDNVRLYRPDPFFLLFIGSDSPLEVERQMLETGEPFQNDALRPIFAHIGFQSVEDVAVTLALDDASLRALCAGSPINTDDKNYLAMRSRPNLEGAITLARLDEMLSEHDPVVLGNTGFHEGLPRALDRAYMTPRLASRGLGKRAFAMLGTIADPVRQNVAAARLLGLGGDVEGAARSLRAALSLEGEGDAMRIGTEDPDAIFAYLRDEIYAVTDGSASSMAIDVAGRLPDPYLAVIEAAGKEAQDDWGGVAALDDRLAAARPRHECYVEAVQLRASWRANVASPEHRALYGRDAVLLIDQALAITPQVSAFQIRILAGNAAGRPDVVIETFSALTRYMTDDKTPLADVEAEQIKALFRNAIEYFPTILSDPLVRPQRVAELTALLEQLLETP